MSRVSVLKSAGFGLLGVGLPLVSFAAGPDVSDLVAAVDLGTVITGVLAVFAVMVGVVVAMKGGSYILSAIKRG